MDISQTKKLQVGVVGCGIAGLSVAIALSRAGHTVELFERSQFKNEVGAAIVIGPNATRILTSWGFDFAKAGALDCAQMRRIKADTLDVDSEEVFTDIDRRYGAKWLFFHRADLHTGLRDLVSQQSPTPKLNLATPVTTIDPDTGIITLATHPNPTTIQKDLIIIADGSHSTLIPLITQSPAPLHKSPMSMYRFLQPFPTILTHPQASQFYISRPSGFTTFYKAAVGRPGLLLHTYPSRSNTLLYCALVHPTKPQERDLEGWDSPANYSDVIADAAGFHPAVQAICENASDVKVYTQMWRDPLPTLSRSRAVLVGDAAHLMLPTHGQGASQAVEDAAALEVLFNNSASTSTSQNPVTPETVPSRLSNFTTLRLPRVAATQTMSNKMMGDLAKMLEQVRTFYKEGRDGPVDIKVPGPKDKTFSSGYNDWFFGYDVVGEAERVVRESGLEKRPE